MNDIETTVEHFKALQALSSVNLQISEARNSLTKLQEEETEYLVSREKKAVERIQSVLEQSHSLVEETNKNYEIIQDFAKSVAGGAKFLAEASESFSSLIEAKDKHYENWERDIKNQETTITSLRNGLKVEMVTIENSKKQIELGNKKLNQDKIKFEDERATVQRAITRLKQGRI